MNSRSSLHRRTAAALTAGVAAVALAACGGSGSGSTGHVGHGATPSSASSAPASGPASQDRHNAADVAFAQGMIPHHRQAVQMADLAPSRAASPEVRKLAEDIEKAQDPEIRTLSEWLVSWGEKVPAEGAADHSHHAGMEGMMSAEDMAALGKSSGKAFDTAFLEMMIRHHEGAVTMAKAERERGAYPAATKMADAIAASQSAEIAEMKRLLARD
ncbi:DUF305 domain-containing protein [Streptomyces kanasensis]|uniref:DUF305 domain-containing protein n=1 Tax=Streptomyces kanasensis TaxID=936756 RepID=UPI0036F60A7D